MIRVLTIEYEDRGGGVSHLDRPLPAQSAQRE